MARWSEWADRHALLFGMTSDDDARVIDAWATHLQAAGFTPAEMIAATGWLAANAPPRFKDKHLGALVDRARQARIPAADEGGYEPGSCALCDGTGRVIVPNPKTLAAGRWGTMAVLCVCQTGRWFRANQRGLPTPQMGLDEYEMTMPDWRERLADHARLLAQQSGPPAPPMDALVRKLKERYGLD